jgi:chitinase
MVAGPILMAYFAAWSIYARNYFVADIPADKVTHINYAFANVGADGQIVLGDSWADVEKTFPGDTWDQPLRGNFNQLLKLKQKYPHIKTSISIGGWVNLISFHLI